MTVEHEPLPVHMAGPPRPKRRAWRWVLAGLLVCALFTGGWFAATRFQSPEQIAAGAAAPEAGPITAQVTEGDLARTVSVSTSIVRQNHLTVVIASEDTFAVVTRQPAAAGAAVTNGTVLSEVNGRPRLALQGAFPFYRDLVVGDSGPDVVQLQAGLQLAGFKITPDGKFGKSTENAVKSLYRAAGYDLLTEDVPAPMTPASPATDGSTAPVAEATAVPQRAVLSRTEFVVFAALPAFVTSTPPVGTPIDDDSAITVESGKIVATATLEAAALRELQPGMKATVQGPDGALLPATVESIGAATVTPPEDPDAVAAPAAAPDVDELALVVSIDGDAVPDGWLGFDALTLVTVEVAASDSLLVPTLAVVTGAGEAAHLLKQEDDGSFTRIAVKEIATLAGQSAISPVGDAVLAPGDLVRIG